MLTSEGGPQQTGKSIWFNIYELNGDSFLFEFPNKHMTEQTLKGQGRWKNCSFHIEWWNPLIGSVPNILTSKETWVRLVGIPLHLWSQNVFREIGGVCGGWIATEEETSLKKPSLKKPCEVGKDSGGQ